MNMKVFTCILCFLIICRTKIHCDELLNIDWVAFKGETVTLKINNLHKYDLSNREIAREFKYTYMIDNVDKINDNENVITVMLEVEATFYLNEEQLGQASLNEKFDFKINNGLNIESVNVNDNLNDEQFIVIIYDAISVYFKYIIAPLFIANSNEDKEMFNSYVPEKFISLFQTDTEWSTSSINNEKVEIKGVFKSTSVEKDEEIKENNALVTYVFSKSDSYVIDLSASGQFHQKNGSFIFSLILQ